MDRSGLELYAGFRGGEELPQTNNFERAMEFAKKKHEGQMRDEGVPYFEHIKAVVQILIKETTDFDDTILTIAALHDVLEDTDCTYEELKEEFGSNIADAVNLLTRKPMQSFDDYAREIFTNDEFPYVRKIKLADRLHNLTTLPNTNNTQKIVRKVRETERCILPYKNCSPRNLMQKIEEQVAILKIRPEFAEPSRE